MRGVGVVAAGLLLLAGCGQTGTAVSGPYPDTLPLPRSRSGAPSSERPPWRRDLPPTPERYRLPDDGFSDFLAEARQSLRSDGGSNGSGRWA